MGTVLVGVDGSEHSRAALRWALDEACLRGAHVLAIHGYRAAMAREDLPAYADLKPAAIALLADEVGKALADAGTDIHVDQWVSSADAAVSLVRAATADDLVVVGTRGHGAFASALLGSTSHYVACHAPCPVVVVPAARHDPGGTS